MEIARQVQRLGLRLWAGLHYGPLRASTPQEEALIRALRAEFARMPHASPVFCAASERLWTQFQDNLREDVFSADPRGFLSWNVVTRTMFLAFSKYAAKELAFLRRQPDWHSRWEQAIRESPVGRPAPFPFYPKTSANLIQCAYSLCQFEEHTGIAVAEFDEALEFGGGYGSMCRLFFNLGFGGIYAIYDLLPFSSLQSYYLKSVGIPVLRGGQQAEHWKGAVLVSETENLRPLSQPRARRKSLFIATWSMSETPLSIRQQFLPYTENYDAYLIAYQSRFGEVDNCQFFRDWQEKTASTIRWTEVPISQIPGKHTYLFGTRRRTAAPDKDPGAYEMAGRQAT